MDQAAQDRQHEEWLADIAVQLAPVFEHSEEGVYVYLDDRHKICNERLAKMWGYATAAEWAGQPDFLETFVAARPDRVKISSNYHQNVHQRLAAYRLRFTARHRDGRRIRCEADTVPFSYDGQVFAYTFVRLARPTAPRKRRPAPKRKKM